ncbi:MAG: outer membrane protein assembly factor BamC [Acidiferrobacteraceae bacterium]
MRARRRTVWPWLAAPLLLSACAYFGHHTPEYLSAKARRALEIPPGLTAPPTVGTLPPAPPPSNPSRATPTGATPSPGAAAALGAPAACTQTPVLVKFPGVSLVRAGNQRWLRVQGSPSAVWASVQAFFVQHGFAIRHSRPAAGIFSTQWRSSPLRGQETPVEKGLERLFSGLYAAGRKQRYRVRLERGHAGATEVYVQYQAVREVVFGASGTMDNEGHYWELEPPDASGNGNVLNLLAVYLGAHPPVSAGAPPDAGGVSAGADPQGQPLLTMTPATHVWSRVGVALAQAGAEVVDASRAKHQYVVRFASKATIKGARVATLDKARRQAQRDYRVTVSRSGDTATITVAAVAPAGGQGATALRNALQRNLQ